MFADSVRPEDASYQQTPTVPGSTTTPDMQRFFRVSPPSVHQMVLTLEREGLIKREPGVPRSIEMLIEPEHLPVLR